MNTEPIELPIATHHGQFVAHYSDKGLAGLDFPRAGNRPRAVNSKSIPVEILRWHRMTTDALQKGLAGRKARNFPPLDWTGTTVFQQAVWRAMLEIPAGETKSYGEIAKTIGKPRAVRAVGGACGANPIPVLVPCHRVLAAQKKIGGFGGGLHWKRTLLGIEGIEVK